MKRRVVLLKSEPLAQLPGGGEHFVSTRTHTNVFREVRPVHDLGVINQKLGRPCDVVLIRSGRRVQQVVAANHGRVWIRQNGERIPGFVGEMARQLRRVDADRYRSYTGGLELRKPFFDSSQLEVAEWSPVAAIKNQQDRFGSRSLGSRGRSEKLVEGNELPGSIGKCELRDPLADLWRSGRVREFARDDRGERRDSNWKQGNQSQHNAQDLAAINLGLAKSPRQSGDKKYQRENGEPQAQPRKHSLQRWSDKKCSVAGYAADGEQQSPPGCGVPAAFGWVRHWLQKSIRIGLHLRQSIRSSPNCCRLSE